LHEPHCRTEDWNQRREESFCANKCVYVNFLENISLGLIILDSSREIVLFKNKAAMDILDAVKKNHDYRTIYAMIEHPKEKHDFGEKKKIHQKNLRYEDKHYGYTVYRIPEGYLCVFILDITEKARLESIAESMNTMNNIGYVFSGIRHEIGNPVNSIKMTLSVLRNNIDNFSQSGVVEYIDRALAETSRIEYLLNSLRNFNINESQKLRDVNLIPFFKSFLSLVELDFSNEGIRIKYTAQREEEWILADPRALQQVMLNVLTNAADALRGRDDPTIAISTSERAGRIKIGIEDNGCGMSEEQVKNLFKPFNTSKQKGTGLGLVICKKMLINMNGTIEIRSRKDVGTVVELTFPEIRPGAHGGLNGFPESGTAIE
jgi:nitrogen-specific signal transduction histidine kinase